MHHGTVQTGMPNFSFSLFDWTIISSQNSFSALDCSSTSDASEKSSGPPTSCSSPSAPPKPKWSSTSSLKTIIVNFQSIKNKKVVLNLTGVRLFNIMGTETWLRPSISSAEIFPPNYRVVCEDLMDGYGGVLLVIKKKFIIDSIDINTTSKVVFAKLDLGRNFNYWSHIQTSIK